MKDNVLTLLHESFNYSPETEEFLDTTPTPVDYLVELREELDILKDRVFSLIDETAREWVNDKAFSEVIIGLNKLSSSPTGLLWLETLIIHHLQISPKDIGAIFTRLYDYVEIVDSVLENSSFSKNTGQFNHLLSQIGLCLDTLVSLADSLIRLFESSPMDPIELTKKDVRLN